MEGSWDLGGLRIIVQNYFVGPFSIFLEEHSPKDIWNPQTSMIIFWLFCCPLLPTIGRLLKPLTKFIRFKNTRGRKESAKSDKGKINFGKTQQNLYPGVKRSFFRRSIKTVSSYLASIFLGIFSLLIFFQIGPLMHSHSPLSPLVHDPLLEWLLTYFGFLVASQLLWIALKFT
jgi:hypothetical protein